MGDKDPTAYAMPTDMDREDTPGLSDLDTEITSLQNLYAGGEMSQNAPSARPQMKQPENTWRSQGDNSALDGYGLQPSKNNGEDAVQRRRMKGQNQTEQMSQYFNTVEERFEYLENEVKSLRAALRSSSVRASGHVETPRRSEQGPSSLKNAPWIPAIKRMGEEEFRLEHPHVLQILIGDISSPLRSNMQNNLFEKASLPQTVPLRLRVRSRPLLGVLEKMTNYTLLKNDGQQSLVFRYPYKSIIPLAPRIRQLLWQMSKRYSQGESKNTDEFSDAPGEQLRRIAEASEDDKATRTSHEKDESVSNSDTFSDLTSQGVLTHGSLMTHTEANNGNEPVSPDIDEKVLLEHLRLFVDFLDDDLRPQMELSLQVDAGSLTHIAFADLWYLFALGQEVVSYDEHEQVFRVISYNHAPSSTVGGAEKPHDASVLRFVVSCIYFDFDGDQYGPIKRTFTIPEYEGTKSVTNLPLFPLVCYPHHDSVRALLVTRGNLFINITRQRPAANWIYSGPTLDAPRTEIESQVIIDFRMARLEGFPDIPKLGVDESVRDDTPGTIKPLRLHCRCPVCLTKSWSGTEEFSGLENEARFLENSRDLLEVKSTLETPSELEWAVLLPKRLVAFVLRDRRWVDLDIQCVNQVHHTDAFRWLVLPAGHREVLEGLIKSHVRQSGLAVEKFGANASDLIRGKGKGLIILLHGVPGVGKSSSAEAAAEAAGRPLLPITSAEIGTDAMNVEKNLHRYFSLAETWGCVLLIDEADVFLASRTKDDLERNALVSVFLRSLEYFKGILFLTTNRVGSFDEAFKSRIHVSLYFPSLEKRSTIKIWKMNLRRVAEEDRLSVDFEGVLQFAAELDHMQRRDSESQVWNGRQIRNAVQTAAALAQFNSTSESMPMLRASDVRNVASSSSHFDHYLTAIHGGTHTDIAAREMLRADDFADKAATDPLPRRAKRESYDAPKYGGPNVQGFKKLTKSAMDIIDDLSDDSESDVPDKSKDMKAKKGLKAYASYSSED